MLTAALALCLLVTLLAFVGMMVVFLGGSGYLPVLLIALTLSLPASLLMLIASGAWFVRRHSLRHAVGAAWHAVPQWLAVALWLGIALIFCGELALLVALQLADVPPGRWQHLPLLAGVLSMLAFVGVAAVRTARNAD